jgi:hypothetical protein
LKSLGYRDVTVVQGARMGGISSSVMFSVSRISVNESCGVAAGSDMSRGAPRE